MSEDVNVTLLPAVPKLGPTFGKGLVGGVGRRSGAAAGTLPDHRLVVTGVEQDVRRLSDYCEVTGSVLADAVPATWLHVLTFPLQVSLMADREFPFPMLGMVHVANTMTQHRPVRVAEELTLSAWADNLAPHRKGHTVDLVGEIRVGDEVVWEGRSTYLAKGKSSDNDPTTAAPPAGDPAAPAAAATTQGEGSGLPETELATWRLPANLGRRYAAVSGDVNPIHVSGLSAKAFGFPRAIAHGMWSHARALAAVQPRLPAAFTVDVRFGKPILLPSTVMLRGSATGASQLAVTSRDGARTHLDLRVTGL